MSDTVDERAQRLAELRATWGKSDASVFDEPFLLAELDRVTAQRDALTDELDMLRLSLRNTSARLEHAQGCLAAEQEVTRVTLQSIRKLTAERDMLLDQVQRFGARATTAEARLQAVQALHVGVEIEDFPICKECDVYWPCSTWHALDGPGQEERRS